MPHKEALCHKRGTGAMLTAQQCHSTFSEIWEGRDHDDYSSNDDILPFELGGGWGSKEKRGNGMEQEG